MNNIGDPTHLFLSMSISKEHWRSLYYFLIFPNNISMWFIMGENKLFTMKNFYLLTNLYLFWWIQMFGKLTVVNKVLVYFFFNTILTLWCRMRIFFANKIFLFGACGMMKYEYISSGKRKIWFIQGFLLFIDRLFTQKFNKRFFS